MTYEQLSYWGEGFSVSSFFFDNMFEKMKYISDGYEKMDEENINTGYWMINTTKETTINNSGLVVFSNDLENSRDALFIVRLAPSGFVKKRQLLSRRDKYTGTIFCDLVEMRKNWRYFEFEPWKSLTEGHEHIKNLEFDISELAVSEAVIDSVRLRSISIHDAVTIYNKWFPNSN